jgi:hypothetical protein
MAELKRRLQKLEAVIESRDESHRLEIEFGYIQRLPPISGSAASRCERPVALERPGVTGRDIPPHSKRFFPD